MQFQRMAWHSESEMIRIEKQKVLDCGHDLSSSLPQFDQVARQAQAGSHDEYIYCNACRFPTLLPH